MLRTCNYWSIGLLPRLWQTILLYMNRLAKTKLQVHVHNISRVLLNSVHLKCTVNGLLDMDFDFLVVQDGLQYS